VSVKVTTNPTGLHVQIPIFTIYPVAFRFHQQIVNPFMKTGPQKIALLKTPTGFSDMYTVFVSYLS